MPKWASSLWSFGLTKQQAVVFTSAKGHWPCTRGISLIQWPGRIILRGLPGGFPKGCPKGMSRATSIGELPAAGNRNGSNVNNVGDNGNYWSSTANDSDNAYNVNFNSNNVNPDNNDNRNNGYSVRLITASIDRPPAHGSFRFLLLGTQQQTQHGIPDEVRAQTLGEYHLFV